jgi:phosphoribosylformylglycinamidine cyclo-ligase
MDYRQSGVDIDAGNETVRRIRRLARQTFTPGVLSDIGSFGGLFRLEAGTYREPVLVSSADGVGTKLKVAFLTGRHDTVGEDLVNHCVNDIVVQGARPLFFLDYLATGHLLPDVAEQIIGGIARGCRANGCALLGGETAEMPGFYADGEYDLAGFIVGVVDRSAVVDGRTIRPGDALVALPSAGLHTNGYSLARRVLLETARLTVDAWVPELGATVGAALLAPHLSYWRGVEPILQRGWAKGLAHVTGGGITENLPRMLPPGCSAAVWMGSWEVPPLFRLIQSAGGIDRGEMFRTFNMGVGMIVACGDERVEEIVETIAAAGGHRAWRLGAVVAGEGDVRYVEAG